MDRSNIATIVPLYNRCRTVLRTLETVAAQTLLPTRLIVVDDGSNDCGAQVVRDWSRGIDQRIEFVLLVQDNRGVSAARNRGLALAKDTQYVAFLDSDDLWPPDFLERAASVLQRDAHTVAATADRQFVAADGTTLRRVSSNGLANLPAVWMLEHGADIASATLLRTDKVLCQGGFDTALHTGEDCALFMPLSLEGRWRHVPGEPVTLQRGLAESLGDAANLSGLFHDNRRTWARVYETFFVTHGHAFLRRRACRKLLARAWYQAGRELAAHGVPSDAASCFFKAVSWNPWRSKYFDRLVRAWWTARFQSGSISPAAQSPASLPSPHESASGRRAA